MTGMNESNESDYVFANSLEVLMSFETDEIVFDSFARNDEQAYSVITKRLEVLMFIVDIDEMIECSSYLMRSLRAIQRDVNKINEYKKRKSKNKLLADIKRVAKINRFNFELAYNNNRSKLTEPFNEPVSDEIVEQQLS